MESKELRQYIDQQRWLMNNGLISEDVKNQLFFCGSIVHKEVQAVEMEFEPENKSIKYMIYVNADLLAKIEKYKRLSTSTTVFGMWRFKRLLKKEGSLDFQKMLSKFVTDFCGPNWFTEVEISDFSKYVEHGEEEGGNLGESQLPNKNAD